MKGNLRKTIKLPCHTKGGLSYKQIDVGYLFFRYFYFFLFSLENQILYLVILFFLFGFGINLYNNSLIIY
jgi:hypothetical protein